VRRAVEGARPRRAAKVFQASALFFQAFPSFFQGFSKLFQAFPKFFFGRFVEFQGLVGEKGKNRRSANSCGLSVGRRSPEGAARGVSRGKDSADSYFQKRIVGADRISFLESLIGDP
jgi:hypothetical protein